VIEISKPVCQAGHFGSQRIDGVHGRHIVWSGGGSEGYQCEGLTQEAADVTAMVNELREVAGNMDLDWLRDKMVFECHPAVLALIPKYVLPSFGDFAGGHPQVLQLGLPVVAEPGLPWGGWRIVLAQGRITDDRI